MEQSKFAPTIEDYSTSTGVGGVRTITGWGIGCEWDPFSWSFASLADSFSLSSRSARVISSSSLSKPPNELSQQPAVDLPDVRRPHGAKGWVKGNQLIGHALYGVEREGMDPLTHP